MDKPKQETLFDLDKIPVSEKRKTRRVWYYLTRRLRTEMMYSKDEDGLPLWCEHDTRNAVPYLYNEKQNAEIDAAKHAANIERWYFSEHKKLRMK